ncbi:MAG: hypothetical protein JW804_09260 [Sedimentisphaerales bacterium]|nr:hypothetical protein [Sedimentisphaerales bacterium]
MLKKFFIIGLILLVAGLAAVALLALRERNWSKVRADYKNKYSLNDSNYLQQYQLWLKIPEYQRSEFPWDVNTNSSLGTIEQLKQHQQERFIADIDSLSDIGDELYPVAKLLYGDDWQKRLANHNQTQEIIKAGFISAILVSSIGAVMTLSSGIGLACVRLFGKSKKEEPSETDAIEDENEKDKEQQSDKESIQSILNCHPYSNQATETDCEDSKAEQDSREEAEISDKEPAKVYDGLEKNIAVEKQADEKIIQNSSRVKLLEMLYRRKEKEVSTKSADNNKPDEHNKGLWNRSKNTTKKVEQPGQNTKKVVKQINLVKDSTEDKGEVISESLNKLSEEVAAIRRYTGQQQDGFKSLRESYDWNIIRNFALRVIRCVDNLESRINSLSPDDPAKGHLEEIRDELVFSLESSGLERYEPEVNSEFRGNQKIAEAVKEKKHTNQADLKGKISQVLRSGYRYVIDKENYKVIRAAQVKLFG